MMLAIMLLGSPGIRSTKPRYAIFTSGGGYHKSSQAFGALMDFGDSTRGYSQKKGVAFTVKCEGYEFWLSASVKSYFGGINVDLRHILSYRSNNNNNNNNSSIDNNNNIFYFCSNCLSIGQSINAITTNMQSV